MATQTTHYNLTKPALTDPVDVAVLDENFDIIDSTLYAKQDAESGKGLSTNDFTTAQKTVLDALSALLTASNNGKVLGIVNGALAAVDPSSGLPDGE